MNITIVDKATGVPEVHRAGCAELRKSSNREQSNLGEVTSKLDVAAEHWDCIIAENGATPADYVDEMKFHGCTRGLPQS